MNAMQALALADEEPRDPEFPDSTLGDRLSDAQVNSLYASAYQLADRGNHDQASSLFALLGMYRPQVPKYAFAVGVCFRKLGKYEDAIRMFGRAQKLEPLNHEPAFQVVECMLLLGHREHAQALLKSMAKVARRNESASTLERVEAILSFLEAPAK